MKRQSLSVVSSAVALLFGAALTAGCWNSAQAKVPPPEPTYPSWRVEVNTGNDDLRGDSEAWVTLRTGSRTFECFLKHQHQPGFAAHSSIGMNCSFEGGAVPAGQLWRAIVTVHFRSHKSGFESDDKWDIRRLQIRPYSLAYVAGSTGSMCLNDMYDRRRDTEYMTLTTALSDINLDRLEWRNHCVHP